MESNDHCSYLNNTTVTGTRRRVRSSDGKQLICLYDSILKNCYCNISDGGCLCQEVHYNQRDCTNDDTISDPRDPTGT